MTNTEHLISSFFKVKMCANWLLNQFDTPIIVLIYHRVTTLSSDPQLLAVSPDNFLSQMLFLKDNFPVLRFEDAWTKIDEPSIVITFDDGYADNVNEALPILESVGIPATFFVSTGGIGSECEFWWDELERILLQRESFPELFELRDARFGRCWQTRNNEDRFRLYNEIHPLIKQIDVVRRADWFKQLRDWVGITDCGRTTHRMMSINELMKLASSRLVTIGAHTVSHTPLATLSGVDQQREIVESKRTLEELTGREISVFSYPFGGKSDYSHESIHLCSDAGFVRSASNFPGQVHSWTDAHQVPRHLVRNWTLEIFKQKIKEFHYR